MVSLSPSLYHLFTPSFIPPASFLSLHPFRPPSVPLSLTPILPQALPHSAEDLGSLLCTEHSGFISEHPPTHVVMSTVGGDRGQSSGRAGVMSTRNMLLKTETSCTKKRMERPMHSTSSRKI